MPSPTENLADLPGDLQVLAGRDHERANGGVPGADLAVGASGEVAFAVQPDAEEGESMDDPLPHRRGVLADSSREHQCVEPVHRCGHRGDRSPQPVDVHIEGQTGSGIPRLGRGEDRTHVRRAGHLAFSLLGPAVTLAAAGLTGGLVYGLSAGDVGRELPRVLAGAMVQLPAVWVLAGLTVALFGLLPRFAWAGWVALAVFLLLWMVQMSVPLSQWLLDLSPFFHIPTIPGGEMTATPLISLVAITAVLAVAGLVEFRRRDIAST